MPRPHKIHTSSGAHQDELLRLWGWRNAITLFWVLFVLGLLPVYLLFDSALAAGVWCLVFTLPLALSIVVLRLAECPSCDRRLSPQNPFPALVLNRCPHCGLPLNPGGEAPPRE